MTTEEVIRELEYVLAEIKYRGRPGEKYVSWDDGQNLIAIGERIRGD